MKRLPPCLLAALCLLQLATPAMAWEPIDPAQPVWRRPAGFHVNELGSDDLAIGTVEATAIRAFEDWTTPECTDLVVEYLGLTERTALEYTQVISWTEQSWELGQETIGATLSSFDQGPAATIAWSTMQLNGQDYRWISGQPRSSPFDVDLYSILVHEAGHYLGLGHSSDPAAAMTARYSGLPLAIAADDVEGICALYPAGGIAAEPTPGPDVPTTDPETPIDEAPPPSNAPPAPEPCTGPGCDPTMIYCRDAADCQAHRVCIEARCRDATEVVGEACSFDDECESGLCLDVDGEGMCTARCTADLDCPEDFICDGRPGFTTCHREVLVVEGDAPSLADPVIEEPAADDDDGAAGDGGVLDSPPQEGASGGPNDDGGCNVSAGAPHTALAWPALALLGLALRRRRQRSRR